MDQLLKVTEAADILKISRATMYLIISEEKIPHVKVRGCTRIQEEDLNKYIRQNTSKPLKIDKEIKRFKYKPGMKIV
jgi:excisionase family DNA binding protein